MWQSNKKKNGRRINLIEGFLPQNSDQRNVNLAKTSKEMIQIYKKESSITDSLDSTTKILLERVARAKIDANK